MHRCKLWLCNVKFPVRRRQSDRLARAYGHLLAVRRTTETEIWQASGKHVLCKVAFALRFTPQPAAQATETLLLLWCCANHCQSVQEKKIDACRAQRQKRHPQIRMRVWKLHQIGLKDVTRHEKTKRKRGQSVFERPLNRREKTEMKKGQTQRPKTNGRSWERSQNYRELKDGGRKDEQELKKAAQGDHTLRK